MSYIRPVPFTGISSWRAHNRRNPPSQESGVDYYCPIGTPVVSAGAGVVVDMGNSTGPATGRFVTVDLDDYRRVRYLHLSQNIAYLGQRVGRGQVIAYSGASGYGQEDWSGDPDTGGAHVHTTLWPFHRYAFGVGAATLDFEEYADQTPTGGGDEEDDMFTDQDRERLNAVYAALFGPANLGTGATELRWTNIDGDPRSVRYGVLDIDIYTQSLVAQTLAKVNKG